MEKEQASPNFRRDHENDVTHNKTNWFWVVFIIVSINLSFYWSSNKLLIFIWYLIIDILALILKSDKW